MSKDLITDQSSIPGALAKVTNNLLDKCANATGYIIKPKNIKLAKINAQKSIIEEISTRTDINPIERYAIISNIKQITKQHKNNAAILKIASEHLNPSAKPENIDDDWLLHFFERSKNISSEDMQKIWGKILAGEANQNNSFSKKLLDILPIMSFDDAKKFMSIIPFCIDTDDDEDPIAPIIINRSGNEIYQKHDITFNNLISCERLGLVKHTFEHLYFKSRSMNISYENKKYLISSKIAIPLGECVLTLEGIQLVKICDRLYDSNFLNYIIDYWKSNNIKVEQLA